MTILVTGATGSVGGHIVHKLSKKGIKVRALSRSGEKTAIPEGVQFVSGDLDKPETITPHLVGVSAMFLLTQSSQTDETYQSNKRIIELAKEANVKRIVAIMDYPGNPIEEVIENSGLEWTILRPTEFMKNILYDWAESIKTEGVIRTAFPDNLTARIHDKDIADVAVKALTEDGHSEKKYNLTGPKALSAREMAVIISDVLEKPIDVITLTKKEVVDAWVSNGYDEDFVNYFVIEMGNNPPEALYTVLSTVEEVTGHPARTFKQWVEENQHLLK
jgi:uncharacterized protein YbjT (DUF2867 family)